MSYSVVIPAFNPGPFLREAVGSALAQTLPPGEILVVDDGCTDGSLRSLDRLPVTALQTAGRQGPSAARNLGLRHASYDLVAFLDADDRWLPHHGSTLVALLGRHPEAALAFSRIAKFRADRPVPTQETAFPEGPFAAFRPLLVTNFIPQSTVVARRAALLEVGGYDESIRLAEDFELWLRVAARHPVVGCPAATCEYRVHADQSSRRTEALLRSGWSTRLTATALAGNAGGASFERELAQAYEADLRSAWGLPDAGPLAVLMEIGRSVPALRPIARRWRFRVALAHPVWRLLRRVKRGLGGRGGERASPGAG